jgi:hypothetical protein
MGCPFLLSEAKARFLDIKIIKYQKASPGKPSGAFFI